MSTSGISIDEPPRVLVLGAGMSGLVAAYELERLGFRVEVLEGSHRIGGRVLTHRFGAGPGAPAVELGAMRIPSHHRRTLDYIRQLGMGADLGPFSTLLSEENAFLRTSGGFVPVKDAAEPLCAEFRGELDAGLPGRADTRSVLLFGAWLTAVVNAIAPTDLRRELRESLGAELMDLAARVDLEPFLRGPRADRLDLNALFSAHPGLRAGCGGRLNSFLDDILTETGPALLRLRGGMDRLPRALAERLAGPVRLGHHVIGLHVRPGDVRVTVRAGLRTVVRHADLAVCTLPFPALRRTRLSGFDADKLAMIEGVNYCPATKVALHCREPFWLRHGIRGGASSTGGRIRQTYYPPAEEAEAGENGAALLASYTIGPEAAWLGRLPPRRRHQLVIRELSAAHPELRRPGMVLDAASCAWGSGSPFTVGCTTRWGRGPRECEAERARAARPVHRLFFAGEHCSTAPAWIEGAVESALRAVAGLARFPGARDPGRGSGLHDEAGVA